MLIVATNSLFNAAFSGFQIYRTFITFLQIDRDNFFDFFGERGDSFSSGKLHERRWSLTDDGVAYFILFGV